MVATPPTLAASARSLAPLAVVLALASDRRQALRAWLAGLAAIAHAEAALALRLARICAWLKRQDLASIGFSSWTAFAREHVELRDSWLRDLMRLVESPLDLVKEAVCQGLLPLRIAVRAPGQVARSDEATWLKRAVLGDIEPSPPPRPSPVHLDAREARVIREARRLARLLRGRHESTCALDAWIVDRWRAGASPESLLAEAQATPPPPDHPDLAWGPSADPATGIVGPWAEPASIAEAVSALEEVQDLRRTSVVVLGVAWDEAVHHALWFEVGLDGPEALAREVLGRSMRSMQRIRRLGRLLGYHDEVRRELLRGGLDLDRAEIAMEAAWINPVGPWVALARRVSRRELGLVARRVRHEGSRATAPYRIPDPTTVAGGAGASQVGLPAAAREAVTGVEGAAAGVAGAGAASSADGPHSAAGEAVPGGASSAGDPTAAGASRVAGAVATPEPEWIALPPTVEDTDARPDDPLRMRIDPDLPAAAAWLLATVRIPKQRGFGRVKERDAFVCQNPLCGRRAIRNHAHHLVFRSRGGLDALENGITLCGGCHLRLVHTGRVTVEVSGEDLLWRYPLGRSVRVLGGNPARAPAPRESPARTGPDPAGVEPDPAGVEPPYRSRTPCSPNWPTTAVTSASVAALTSSAVRCASGLA